MTEDPTIWIEKYRPSKLSEVVGQDEIVERLSAYMRNGNIPHLMFCGTAGIGKTTCAAALAMEFYGDYMSSNFQELNASDDRGIDVVRNRIKQVARGTPDGGFPFKMIFLDEADALTTDAQAALRRTMEHNSENCRFILSCNYSSKIIDPIQSRCAIYRFKPVSAVSVERYLGKIARDENLEINDAAMGALIYISGGDMRKAINALQGAAMIGKSVTEEMVYAISASATPEEIEHLISNSVKCEFETAEKILHYLINTRGISANELITQIYRTLIKRDMDHTTKIGMIDALGETDFRLSEGANTNIQMEALIAKFVIISGGVNG